jgi:predicted nucleic acid-binding protein
VIFADTNILLRSVDTSAEHYPIVENALAKLRGGQETLCIAPQNLIEFWSVATRPAGNNGLGMPSSRAAAEITALLKLFRLLPYRQVVVATWQRLVVTHGVSGKQAHGAHIVAMMQVHSVTAILTFNGDNFKRYLGITVLAPENL